MRISEKFLKSVHQQCLKEGLDLELEQVYDMNDSLWRSLYLNLTRYKYASYNIPYLGTISIPYYILYKRYVTYTENISSNFLYTLNYSAYSPYYRMFNLFKNTDFEKRAQEYYGDYARHHQPTPTKEEPFSNDESITDNSNG